MFILVIFCVIIKFLDSLEFSMMESFPIYVGNWVYLFQMYV